MKRENQFDEVMIVNPSQGRTNSNQRVRLMRFHNIYPPELSGYAEPETYGYYAEPEPYGYYGEPQPYGYVCRKPVPTCRSKRWLLRRSLNRPMGITAKLIRRLVTTVKLIPPMAITVRLIRRLVITAKLIRRMVITVKLIQPLVTTAKLILLMDTTDRRRSLQGPATADGPDTAIAEPEPVGYYAEETPMGYYGEEAMPMGYYGQPPRWLVTVNTEFAEEYPGVA